MSEHGNDHDPETTAIAVVLTQFARHSERVAIRHDQGEWTYAELLARVYRMARVLRAQGIRRGDVVALLTGNRPETFVLRYAANVLGCCTAVLYDDLATPLLTEMLRATDTVAMVFDADRYAAAALAIGEQVRGIKTLALGECGHTVNVTALAATESAEPIRIDAQAGDLSEIRLTGGSTGRPKGIPRTSRVPPYLSLPALTMWKDSTQLLCTPIGHLGGTLAEVVLAAGGRVVLHERFDPGKALAAIETERVTYMWAHPDLLHQMLDHPTLEHTDTSSLRSLHLGGWASTPHRVTQAIERFGPVVVQGYGANEVGQITWLSQEEHLDPELLTTVGRPVRGVDVTIRDSDGRPVGTGVTGEIWVRGPNMMTGYYKQPKETAQVLVDGWFRSGDLGFLNAEGYLSIVGRIKEVIISPAGHVYPTQIEDLLMRHHAIHQAAVFGFISEDNNDERVCAAVVPTPTNHISQDDVVQWVSQQCGKAYAPEIVLVLDALPQTGSCKPDRNALRRIVAKMARS
jgi:fatty-acyl-CoA synthase